MIRVAIISGAVLVAGCSPITPERAADRCEERARAAQGPEVGVTIGANSETGPFTRSSIAISLDALQGRDPIEVYESCVFGLTGELPVRPARLRAL